MKRTNLWQRGNSSSVINMMLTRADINGEGIKSSMEYVCGMKGYMSIFSTCIERLKNFNPEQGSYLAPSPYASP